MRRGLRVRSRKSRSPAADASARRRRDADQRTPHVAGSRRATTGSAVQFAAMRKAKMKTVVGISLGAGDQDFEFDARLLGRHSSVRRLGTNGSTAKAVKLLKHWEQTADAIGLGVVKDSYTVGRRATSRRTARG